MFQKKTLTHPNKNNVKKRGKKRVLDRWGLHAVGLRGCEMCRACDLGRLRRGAGVGEFSDYENMLYIYIYILTVYCNIL